MSENSTKTYIYCRYSTCSAICYDLRKIPSTKQCNDTKLSEIVRVVEKEECHCEVPPIAPPNGGYVAVFVMRDKTLRIVATHDLRQYMNRMRFYGEDPGGISQILVSNPCIRYEYAKRNAIDIVKKRGIALTMPNLPAIADIVDSAVELSSTPNHQRH